MRLCEYLEVGRKMKTARTQRGITQGYMAKQLGLGHSAYSNYENGYSDPPAEIIEKFCAILGITMDELIGMELGSVAGNGEPRTFSDLIRDIAFYKSNGICHVTGLGSLKNLLSFDASDLSKLAAILDELDSQLISGELTQEEYDSKVTKYYSMYDIEK